MNQVCCCSDPYCLANGCKLMGQYKPYVPQTGYTYTWTTPLTAEEVRRIVREELDRKKPRKTQGRSRSEQAK